MFSRPFTFDSIGIRRLRILQRPRLESRPIRFHGVGGVRGGDRLWPWGDAGLARGVPHGFAGETWGGS